MKLLLVSLLVWLASADDYDFIIAGAGTAGCVVAAELSANRDVKVLLLDHGTDETGTFFTQSGFFGNGIPYSKNQLANYIWSTDTTAQNLVVPKVFGGSSSINGELFQSQTVDDLASWNDSNWTFNATLADRKYIENFQSGGNPAVHGYSGPIYVNEFPADPILSLIQASMMEVFNLSYNNDSNSGYAEGVSNFARNIQVDPTNNTVAIRQDTYSRFLQPVLSRSNLEVVAFAKIQGLDINSNGKNTVYYTIGDECFSAKAKKEVILSLGIYTSPQILMLSGIGDCTKLAALGIDCVYNNTQVGQNLRESSLGEFIFLGPTPSPVSLGAISGAIYRSPNFTGQGTNMEVAVTDFPSPIPGLSTYLWTIVQHKLLDSGSVTLQNADPSTTPLIQQNLYSNPNDIYEIVDLFVKVRRVMANVGLFEEIYPGQVYSPGTLAVPLNSTTQQIATFLLNTIGVEFHGLGTCRLGSVVDSRLRVLGVSGLRVIDNSIVPIDLSTHATCWTATFIGKVGSRFVMEDWGL